MKKLAQGVRSFLQSDLTYRFFSSKMAVVAAATMVLIILLSLLAPIVAPTNPYDSTALILMDSLTPPNGESFSGARYILGTDDQGRDILSTLMYGSRISIFVGVSAVILSMLIGTTLGLIAGFAGGRIDSLIMRIADVQLSFPSILVALLIFGVARAALPSHMQGIMAIYILIVAIALSDWVQYARTVRGATLVEQQKEYIQAATLMGIKPWRILLRHILPNVAAPISVIATLGFALAIIAEATLSFLGVGVPPTTPSLGTLIRIGNNYLFSGEWWITLFPGVTLVALALSVNILGDWLRDALNPRLSN